MMAQFSSAAWNMSSGSETQPSAPMNNAPNVANVVSMNTMNGAASPGNFNQFSGVNPAHIPSSSQQAMTSSGHSQFGGVFPTGMNPANHPPASNQRINNNSQQQQRQQMDVSTSNKSSTASAQQMVHPSGSDTGLGGKPHEILRRSINENYYNRKARRRNDNEPTTTNAANSTAVASHRNLAAQAQQNTQINDLPSTSTTTKAPQRRQSYTNNKHKSPAAQNSVEEVDCDDEHHDYIIRIGEIFNYRYRIESSVGKVHSDKWPEPTTCFLRPGSDRDSLVRTYEQPQLEGKYFVVKLQTHFIWRKHLCLVFELLSYNLYDLLRNTNFRGVSLNLTRNRKMYCYATLKGQPSKLLILALLVSMTTEYTVHPVKILRSPEVLLGISYDTQIDIWSLGHSEFDQMMKIVELDENGEYRCKKARDLKTYKAPGSRRLTDIIGVHTGGPYGRRFGEPGHAVEEYLKFKDLIAKNAGI
uniref:Uncharacterized protein n=1 Tax=Ditylenchus dipsaci TaxID=166011 RepID=A0A915D8I6_9BILA